MPKKESGGKKKKPLIVVKKVKDKDGNVIVFTREKDGIYRKAGWKVKDGVAIKKKIKVVPKPKPKPKPKKTKAEIDAMVAKNNAKIVKDNFGSFFVNQEEDITKANVSDFFGEIEGKGIAEKMAKTANGDIKKVKDKDGNVIVFKKQKDGSYYKKGWIRQDGVAIKIDESKLKPPDMTLYNKLMKTDRHGTILSGVSGFSGGGGAKQSIIERQSQYPTGRAKGKLPAKQQTDYSDVETKPTKSQLYYEEQLHDFYDSVNRADYKPAGISVIDKMKHLTLADKPRAINQPKTLEKQVIPKLIPKETYSAGGGFRRSEAREDLRERHRRAKIDGKKKFSGVYPPQDTYNADPTSQAVNPVEYTRKPRPKAKSKPKPTSAEGATPEALPKPKGRMKEGSRRYNELHGIKNPKRVRTDYVKKDPKDYKKMGRPRKTEVLPIPKEVPLYLTADKFRDPFAKGKLVRGGNIKFKFDPKTKQYLNKNYKLGFGEYGSVRAFKKDEKIDVEYQYHKRWYKENVEKYYN